MFGGCATVGGWGAKYNVEMDYFDVPCMTDSSILSPDPLQ